MNWCDSVTDNASRSPTPVASITLFRLRELTSRSETFDGLLKEQYANDLLVQNPVSSATGKAFLLHSIKAKGRDSYLDFWQKLKENGVRVHARRCAPSLVSPGVFEVRRRRRQVETARTITRLDGVGRTQQVAADAPTPNQDVTPAVQTQSSYEDKEHEEYDENDDHEEEEEYEEEHDEHEEDE